LLCPAANENAIPFLTYAAAISSTQYGLESIPFGGIGQSGFGQYHGKYSFEMFSHKKAVLKRSLLIEFMFRYPPWDDRKLGLLRHVFRYDYVSLFLALLGLRR
jgi:aldehyde dehydrogenase (NAD+)